MSRFSRHTFMVAAAVSLAAMLAAPRATAGPDPRDAIGTDRLVEHIAVLTSEEYGGRRTGERGNVEAARYVAGQFAQAGLKPIGTCRQLDPKAKMDASGYFQPFTFPSTLAAGKDNLLQATVGRRCIRYRLKTEFEPLRFSGTGQATGEVVFVGYGIKDASAGQDDYAGVDVTGKIVLLLESVPNGESHAQPAPSLGLRQKASTAKGLGAVAVLAVRAPDAATAAGMPADGGRSQIPVLSVKRSVAESWLKVAGKSLTDKASAVATGVTATVHASIEQVYGTSANIVGYLPGSDPKLRDEVVVIGAHVDHLGMGGPESLATSRKPAMHPGADDNASGSAGVMGLAHYFGESSTRPKRSLLFICFSGEEEGLLGSQAYTRSPIIPLERTAAMINMDMIGRMSENRLTVMGTGSSPSWNGLLDDLNREAAFRLSKSPGGYGGSDHQSFFVKSIPVLFFFTGIHPDYHKPSDTLDKINGPDQERVVEYVAAIADRIANTPERPTFQQPPAQPGEGGARRRARVSLGTIPEYGVEVAGVKLSGVRPGSPAEKAGLKGGDIIVKMAGREVGGLTDFMAALNACKPGDVVEIVVQRGGETKTLKATLEASPGA